MAARGVIQPQFEERLRPVEAVLLAQVAGVEAVSEEKIQPLSGQSPSLCPFWQLLLQLPRCGVQTCGESGALCGPKLPKLKLAEKLATPGHHSGAARTAHA